MMCGSVRRAVTAWALLLASGLVAGGCAPPSREAVNDTAGGAITLQLDGGPTTLGSFSYDIEGTGFSRLGTIDVSHSTTLSAIIADIPAGPSYTITLSGTAADAATSCAGSASFAVTAHATATVSIHLTCHESPRTGSVLVNGALNVCPIIDGAGASPAEVTVGSTLSLTVAAHDADSGPSALAYKWDATGGSIGAGTTPNALFLCVAPGPVTVTLTVTDGDTTPGCADSQTLQVTCTAGFTLTATPADLTPGQTATLVATATDGATHAQASYAWSDGLGSLQTGIFTPGAISPSATSTYAPAGCNALGGGDHVVTVAVAVTDPSLPINSAATTTVTVHCPPSYYTTKTPYQPFADPAAASAPPTGFSPVFTQLVTRHGSRGLSSLKYDAAALAMWQRAAADGALTPLGASLGADLQKIMRANALLGYGVPGVSTPGYGNLTQIGINEQKQLAVRLLQRLPGFFANVAAGAGGPAARQIVTVSSGVDRAVDSDSFFSGSIAATNPALAPLLTPTPALTAYPSNKPAAQPIGTNRFLLYFHKLAAKTDLVTSVVDPYFQTYQDSLAFQAFATDADMNAKVSSVLADPSVTAAARIVLEGLFAKSFVDKIDSGAYSFANTGTFIFTSDDGLFTTTLTGDGKTTVKSLSDAASMLYNVYVVVPAMVNELGGLDFTKYIPNAQAAVLAYLQDAQDFYQMGPSILEKSPVTFRMAQALQNDFFTELDAVAGGDLSHAAKLRFTHAEIIVPFADIMGLDGAATAAPLASTYTYANNPWRGQVVASMAANQQWDAFQNAAGTLIVRLLYNEKEIDFKPSCASARYLPGTHYYEYGALKTCYGR